MFEGELRMLVRHNIQNNFGNNLYSDLNQGT